MSNHLSGILPLLVLLAIIAVQIAGTWRVFEKADQPGWGALIPIYNVYLMIEIGDNPAWYLIGLFVPILNIYIYFRIFVDLAEAFGKGIGYGLGLWFFPVIFFPLLGFGDASYRG